MSWCADRFLITMNTLNADIPSPFHSEHNARNPVYPEIVAFISGFPLCSSPQSLNHNQQQGRADGGAFVFMVISFIPPTLVLQHGCSLNKIYPRKYTQCLLPYSSGSMAIQLVNSLFLTHFHYSFSFTKCNKYLLGIVYVQVSVMGMESKNRQRLCRLGAYSMMRGDKADINVCLSIYLSMFKCALYLYI